MCVRCAVRFDLRQPKEVPAWYCIEILYPKGTKPSVAFFTTLLQLLIYYLSPSVISIKFLYNFFIRKASLNSFFVIRIRQHTKSKINYWQNNRNSHRNNKPLWFEKVLSHWKIKFQKWSINIISCNQICNSYYFIRYFKLNFP